MDGRGIKTFDSTEETIRQARAFARKLVPGDVLCLHGDLGVGKTTFAKGIIEELCEKVHRDEVTSPTFVTLNLYENVAHFDLYRLEAMTNFVNSGFLEYLEEPYIAIIEWPILIAPLLPDYAYHIEIKRIGGDKRVVDGM